MYQNEVFVGSAQAQTVSDYTQMAHRPHKRRLGRSTKLACYLLVMGSLFCGVLYPVALREYDKQTKAYAASLPDYSKVTPPTPFASGRPVKIDIPSVGVSLPVMDGAYDPVSHTWTLSKDKVQYDTSSRLPNSRTGNTFIYGHATTAVFGPILKLQPDALATITTDNGYVITYKLTAHEVVDPKNTAVLTYDGPSRLMLQTCTGPTLSEFRQLYYFSYLDHIVTRR